MAEILLIDDDPNIHQIVGLFLEDVGHHVHSAPTGQRGLDCAAVEHPDLILLDLSMPGMDGPTTFNALKTNPKTSEIPVMILTVHSPDEVDQDICTEDCVGYLQKPVDMKTLQGKVGQALAC
ncbi:response regulator [Pseudomonadota bacterium]